MLLTKAVSAAVYYVEFGIRIGLLCLSGIVRLDDFILCAVNDENRTEIGLDYSCQAQQAYPNAKLHIIEGGAHGFGKKHDAIAMEYLRNFAID